MMEAIKIEINGQIIYFQDSRDILTKLKEDDEFLLDYIHRSLVTNALVKYGLTSDMADKIVVHRFVEQEFFSTKGVTTKANEENLDLEQDMTEVLTDTDTTTNLEIVWQNKSHPSSVDLEATKLLLKLIDSTKYKHKLDDKTHKKIQIWSQIADDMIKSGFNVGYGKDAAIKCRQKWANIKRTYLRYKGNQKQTGAEYLDPPELFEEVDNIVGKKDIVVPKYLLHTATRTEKNNIGKPKPIEQVGTSKAGTIRKNKQVLEPSDLPGPSSGPSTLQNTPTKTHLLYDDDDDDDSSTFVESSSSQTPTSQPNENLRSIFSSVKKSVKPKSSGKEDILDAVKTLIHQSNEKYEEIKTRQEEQNTMLRDIFSTEEKQRQQFLNLFEELVKNMKKNKKRKRMDYSDEDCL